MPNLAKSKLKQLEETLLVIGRKHDEAMLVEELDGFLAGIIACPDLIPPSRWMPHVWSAAGDGGHEPVFEDLAQANKIIGLIMDHYNSIAKSLSPGPLPYEPMFTFDPNADDLVWELWASGSGRALSLAPESWFAITASGDPDASDALAGLRKLVAIADGESALPETEQDSLTKDALDLVPEWVEALSLLRFAQLELSNPGPAIAAKPGRDHPCPCGSGKKYKKCHGAN